MMNKKTRSLLKEAADFPVLLAVPRAKTSDFGTPLWNVWCTHCHIWHMHGDEPGHRIAHCVDGPYKDGHGYFFVPISDVQAVIK